MDSVISTGVFFTPDGKAVADKPSRHGLVGFHLAQLDLGRAGNAGGGQVRRARALPLDLRQRRLERGPAHGGRPGGRRGGARRRVAHARRTLRRGERKKLVHDVKKLLHRMQPAEPMPTLGCIS